MAHRARRRGVIVFSNKKQIHLLWQTTDIQQESDLYTAVSHDGQKFDRHIGFARMLGRDGRPSSLTAKSIIRANGARVPAELFVSTPGLPGRFMRSGRGGTWHTMATTSIITGPAVTARLPQSKKHASGYLAFFTKTGRSISQAISKSDLSHFREGELVLQARRERFDASNLAPLYTEVLPESILLVYSAKDQQGKPVLGAALFDRSDPSQLLWRSDFALWELPARHPATDVRFLGGFPYGRYFALYIESEERGIEYFPVAEYWHAPRERTLTEPIVLPKRVRGIKITLDRVTANPILEPRSAYTWEAFASFNPAAIALDGRIHLLYRAQGYDGQSVLGYAGSQDGIRIDERSTTPVFVPSRATGMGARSMCAPSGGGTGGCEDPRLVEIDGTVYLMYVAFDGSHPPGVALASISKKHFLEKRWRWSTPRLISRPGQIQKNWVLFPEKIGGRYAILHGLTPEIKIEYLDDLSDLGKTRCIESLSSHGGRGYVDTDRLAAWDNIVRGAGAPPVRTDAGWLVFYHGMDMRDPGKYKVGAMLLDLKHPERILRRALEPVLEPETEYENSGHKRGVVYVCGAVVKDGTLFVYYGASDRTSAVATARLDTFVNNLLRERSPSLTKMNIRKRS